MKEEEEELVELPFKNKEEFEKYINDCPPIPKVSWEMSMDYFKENSFVEKNFRGEFELDLTFTTKALKKLEVGIPQLRSHIPGMRRKSIPKSSSIVFSEMSKLFQIALRLNKEENLSKDEITYWNELFPKVTKEQTSYVRFAWLQWLREGPKKHSQISPEVLEYVNTIWKMKLERIHDYPNFYGNPMVIPLHTDEFKERCQLSRLSTVKKIGRKPMLYYFPHLRLFPVDAKSVLTKLKSDLDLLDKERDDGWPKYKRRFEKIDRNYHPDVSKDELAKSSAYKHDVQLVSSSSAISALVNILGPDSSWDIPVVVKEVDGANGKKKIIFLDKKLPPKSMNVVDRQKFYMKKALKKLFLRNPQNIPETQITKPCLSCSKPNPSPELETNNFFDDYLDDDDDDDDDKLLIDDSERDEQDIDDETNGETVTDKIEKRLDIDDNDQEKKQVHDNEIEEKQDKNENPKRELIQSINDLLPNTTPKCNCIQKKKKALNYMVEYNLWNLKSNEDKNVLLKTSKLKDLKLIIRTTHEGRNRLDSVRISNTKLSAKLEYQPEYGAETVTLSESLRDWSSLLIRKGAFLTRVRVDPIKGEVIQFEKKNIASLTKECQRLHETNPYDLITRIHIILDKLTTLAPGNYLLNHEPESHQCVTVFKATDNKHTLNLRLKYVNAAESGNIHAQFLPLDTSVITPTFYHFRRVPCCFAPSRYENQKRLLNKRPFVGLKKRRKNKNKKKE